MSVFWVCRNGEGKVFTAGMVEFTSPERVAEWRKRGDKPELVEAETLTMLEPLPADARIIKP